MLVSKALVTVLSVAVSVSAHPTAESQSPANANDALIEKRSCPAKKRMYSWNAGCSENWSGRCYDACIKQAPSRKCCQFVLSSIMDKCGWISKNCYCDCYVPA